MNRIDVTRRPPGRLTAAERTALAALLDRVADDFVPPLTVRRGTTQAALKDVTGSASTAYLEEMFLQDNLLGFDGSGHLVAFLSFRASHRLKHLPNIPACIYVSTIAVEPEVRGHGYARQLYETLFRLPSSLPGWIVLRTWSTNYGHLKLLDQLGFDALHTIADDRGPGIDTVYLGRRRS